MDAATANEDELALDAGPGGRAPQRTCIVTRAVAAPESLIRFVLDPEGVVVPDLRGRLPGRGAWVDARRETVAEAVRRRQFQRAFKGKAKAVPEDLADRVGAGLRADLRQALALANKAGCVVTGFGKVEAAIGGAPGLAALRRGGGTAAGLRAPEVAEELLRVAQVLPQAPQVAAVATKAPAQLADHSAASRAGTRLRLAAPRHPVALHRLSLLCLRRSVPGPQARLPSSRAPVLKTAGIRLLTPPPAVGRAPSLRHRRSKQTNPQRALNGTFISTVWKSEGKDRWRTGSLRGFLGLVVCARAELQNLETVEATPPHTYTPTHPHTPCITLPQSHPEFSRSSWFKNMFLLPTKVSL